MIVRGMEELQGVCAAGKLVMERENGDQPLVEYIEMREEREIHS